MFKGAVGLLRILGKAMMRRKKRNLFIAGASRSGTSITADFLRKDRRIIMGRERYAFVLRRGELRKEHFSKNRFLLDFRKDDSHHNKHQPYYGEVDLYFDQANWVGDKLPNLFEFYGYFFAQFPEARIIYMLRNHIEVASSFQVRADKTAQQIKEKKTRISKWPKERGWQSAIKELNWSYSETLKFVHSRNFFILDYDSLFRDLSLLSNLYQFLDMDPPPHMFNSWKLLGEDRNKIEQSRKSFLDEKILRQIKSEIDWSNYNQLLTLSGR